MRDGVAAIRALGSEDFKTYFLCLLAETLAKGGETEAALDVITEALGAVERSGERFYAAELHRQKGELLLMTGHDLAGVPGVSEPRCEIARHQRAWALERRALQSLDNASGRPGPRRIATAIKNAERVGQDERRMRRLSRVGLRPVGAR